MSDGMTGYFNLRANNNELMARLAVLEEENLKLRESLQSLSDVDSVLHSSFPYKFIVAHVVNNTITQVENYLVINKGARDSIAVGMGVVNQNGIVGMVSNVSDHYAQVISLLHPKSQVSACLLTEQSAGSLVWPGDNPQYAQLNDLPRNVVYELGDTVVTSGYGSSFPRGIPIGKIVAVAPSENNNFMNFKVELFTRFDRVNDVHVIQNNLPCPY